MSAAAPATPMPMSQAAVLLEPVSIPVGGGVVAVFVYDTVVGLSAEPVTEAVTSVASRASWEVYGAPSSVSDGVNCAS